MVRTLAINNVQIPPDVSNPMFILHIHSQARRPKEMYIDDQPFFSRQPLFSRIVRPISHVDDRLLNLVPFHPYQFICLTYGPVYFPFLSSTPNTQRKGGASLRDKMTRYLSSQWSDRWPSTMSKFARTCPI
ncbi:hypothetical protein CDAR_480381 [Caerostris darwini]|uniref:Uncharacterized protein n=1 Tax=Caerostris darwini TaxID=1538125 RepID=A0AAV4V1C2_9ARAC|nr:hypothetical protein CDAR_480381 [Caerostris darwini]